MNILRTFSRRHRDRKDDAPVEETRIAERCLSLSRATQEWKSLLHEMEHSGQSSEARYESYYRAYLLAKEKEKRADLELFNARQGLRA